MPSCVVSGCSSGSNSKKYDGQTFPLPKVGTKLREKWIELINREGWKPSDHSRVCDRHFDNSAYDDNAVGSRKRKLKRRKLKAYALPTLFMRPERVEGATRTTMNSNKNEEPEVEQFGQTGPQFNLEDVGETYITDPTKWLGIDHDHNYGTEKVDVVVNEVEIETQEVNHPASEIEILRAELNSMKMAMIEQEKEIVELKRVNAKFKDLDEKLKLVFQPDQIARMKNPKVSNNKKWSSLTLQQCLQLYLMLGPAGYNFLRKERNHPAPGVSTLQFYMSKIIVEPGIISKDILSLLEKKVAKMAPESRWCSLVIDEMTIQAQICYNNTTQEFIGHPTLALSEQQQRIKLANDADWSPQKEMATHALNFELAGLGERWKQLILVHLTGNSIDSKEFKKVVIDVIKQCYGIGLKVTVMTTDAATNNQAL